jgi:hypothetical protein
MSYSKLSIGGVVGLGSGLSFLARTILGILAATTLLVGPNALAEMVIFPPSGMGPPKIVPSPGVGAEVGKNSVKNIPEIVRVNEDEPRSSADKTVPSNFFRGPKVVDPGAREENVRYVYVSRGAWLVKKLQPFLDRLAVEVIKHDGSEVSSNYVEAVRTYAYLCALIASDDGSETMHKKLREAVAIHRKAVSNLRLVWTRKGPATEKLFSAYIDATFFKNLEKDAVKITAGSLSTSRYTPLKEAYADELLDTVRQEDLFEKFKK